MNGDRESWFAANRANWNERAVIHREDRTGAYALERFLAGEETLHAIEAAELPDLRGRRVAHLQCHFGLDTLNLVRRGAVAVGLDFAPAAIEAARDLSRRSGVPADFVLGNVYDAGVLIAEPVDFVYVTWGALNWLPDIAAWAQAVAAVLKPGGQLYLAEAHPSALGLEEVESSLQVTYPVPTRPDRPLAFDETQTYTGDDRPLRNSRIYEWIHSLSQVIAALQTVGLRLEWLHEHPLLVWKMFPSMVTEDDQHYRLPPHWPAMPLSYSLLATKP